MPSVAVVTPSKRDDLHAAIISTSYEFFHWLADQTNHHPIGEPKLAGRGTSVVAALLNDFPDVLPVVDGFVMNPKPLHVSEVDMPRRCLSDAERKCVRSFVAPSTSGFSSSGRMHYPSMPHTSASMHTRQPGDHVMHRSMSQSGGDSNATKADDRERNTGNAATEYDYTHRRAPAVGEETRGSASKAPDRIDANGEGREGESSLRALNATVVTAAACDNALTWKEKKALKKTLKADANEASWREKLEELRRYKEDNGDANVPKRHGPLGRWVHKQRQYYRMMQEGKPSSMTSKRVALLNEIGFVWKLGSRGSKLVTWDERLAQLWKYKALHGDADVPHRYQPDLQLGQWVRMQRQQYRNLQLGRPSQINAERVEALNELGFAWRVDLGRPKKTRCENEHWVKRDNGRGKDQGQRFEISAL